MLQNVIGLISYYLSPTPVNLSDRGRGNVGKAIVSGTWIDHSIKVHRNRGNFVSGIFPFFFFFRRLKERKKKKRNLVSCKANSWWLVRRRVFRERLREEWRIPLPQKSRNNTRSSHSGDAVLGTGEGLRHACFRLHSYRPVSSRKKKRYHNCRNVTINWRNMDLNAREKKFACVVCRRLKF